MCLLIVYTRAYVVDFTPNCRYCCKIDDRLQMAAFEGILDDDMVCVANRESLSEHDEALCGTWFNEGRPNTLEQWYDGERTPYSDDSCRKFCRNSHGQCRDARRDDGDSRTRNEDGRKPRVVYKTKYMPLEAKFSKENLPIYRRDPNFNPLLQLPYQGGVGMLNELGTITTDLQDLLDKIGVPKPGRGAGRQGATPPVFMEMTSKGMSKSSIRKAMSLRAKQQV